MPPRGVVPRESTDVLATDDRELAAAIRHIREHACDGLRVKELVRKTGLSRRALERRMEKLLGRSPKEEITRVQIERAKRLLTETDLPAAAIAEKCGYSQPKYFSQVFHAKVGLPRGVPPEQEQIRVTVDAADRPRQPSAPIGDVSVIELELAEGPMPRETIQIRDVETRTVGGNALPARSWRRPSPGWPTRKAAGC